MSETQETTCRGADCPLACRWRNFTPATTCDVPPGGTWGRREMRNLDPRGPAGGQLPLWVCERYAPDLRPVAAVPLDHPAQGCRDCFPAHDCPEDCVARNHRPREAKEART